MLNIVTRLVTRLKVAMRSYQVRVSVTKTCVKKFEPHIKFKLVLNLDQPLSLNIKILKRGREIFVRINLI